MPEHIPEPSLSYILEHILKQPLPTGTVVIVTGTADTYWNGHYRILEQPLPTGAVVISRFLCELTVEHRLHVRQ